MNGVTTAGSPLSCASGVSRSDLRSDSGLMKWLTVTAINYADQSDTYGPPLCDSLDPFTIGILRAESVPPAPTYTYEVASVKPSDPDQTRT